MRKLAVDKNINQRYQSKGSDPLKSHEGGRRGLFEVPFKRSLGRNEFRSRADERLSAVEPQPLSRQERSARQRVNPLPVRSRRAGG
jgi:hypothetical protein